MQENQIENHQNKIIRKLQQVYGINKVDEHKTIHEQEFKDKIEMIPNNCSYNPLSMIGFLYDIFK